jgi:hypothetical protein
VKQEEGKKIESRKARKITLLNAASSIKNPSDK